MTTGVLHEMLDGTVTRFGRHVAFQAADLKPARCRRKAIRSRKLTNCENTNDLIVLSSLRSCVSSSTRASILVLDRHLSMSRRDRIP